MRRSLPGSQPQHAFVPAALVSVSMTSVVPGAWAQSAPVAKSRASANAAGTTVNNRSNAQIKTKTFYRLGPDIICPTPTLSISGFGGGGSENSAGATIGADVNSGCRGAIPMGMAAQSTTQPTPQQTQTKHKSTSSSFFSPPNHACPGTSHRILTLNEKTGQNWIAVQMQIQRKNKTSKTKISGEKISGAKRGLNQARHLSPRTQ